MGLLLAGTGEGTPNGRVLFSREQRGPSGACFGGASVLEAEMGRGEWPAGREGKVAEVSPANSSEWCPPPCAGQPLPSPPSPVDYLVQSRVSVFPM